MNLILGLIMCSFLLLFAACNKNTNISRIADLPIASTSTPKTLNVGQNIISNVHCEVSPVNGSIIFSGFDIKENANLNFSIKAKALYKNWDGQSDFPLIWIMDTTLSIKTGASGKYILDFYNADTLFKTDTVYVR